MSFQTWVYHDTHVIIRLCSLSNCTGSSSVWSN